MEKSNYRNGVCTERPHFGPKQVRTPRGIRIGLTLILVTPGGRSKILVTSNPILREDDDESLYFKYIILSPVFSKYEMTLYLSDSGVVSYSSKCWNMTNHLLRTGERRLTDKGILKIIVMRGIKIKSLEVRKRCAVCEKFFFTYNDSEKCLTCTLNEITGGLSPLKRDKAQAATRSGFFAHYTLPQQNLDEA